MAFSAERQDLIKALGFVQNHPFYASQDIITITGCGMTDDEVRRHIDSCIAGIASYNLRQIEEKMASPSRKARARRAA